MQTHNAKVEFQQPRFRQHFTETAFHHSGLTIKYVSATVGHNPNGQRNAGRCQNSDHPEQRVQPKFVSDDRAKHHRNGKGNAKAHADKRHCFGAVLFAREIGKQRHNGSGNRTGAL